MRGLPGSYRRVVVVRDECFFATSSADMVLVSIWAQMPLLMASRPDGSGGTICRRRADMVLGSTPDAANGRDAAEALSRRLSSKRLSVKPDHKNQQRAAQSDDQRRAKKPRRFKMRELAV